MKNKKIFMAAGLIAILIAALVIYHGSTANQNPPAEPDAPPAPQAQAPQATPEPPAAEEIAPEPVYEGEAEIQALRAKYGNDEIIGILRIEGTNIDYPVTQHTDNEFYLTHGYDMGRNAQGTVYMDYENNPNATDLNTIIYAHNQNNGAMFHNIRYYEDPAFYESHKYITLKTMEGETKWEIFSYYRPTVDFPYIQVVFPDKLIFDALVEGIVERAKYDTGVTVSPEDTILSLSTCTPDDSANERIVVSAKRIDNQKTQAE